jgi:homogentisate 1,2-dioxygenase
MAYYVQRGKIPPKRHTQFRQPDGSLYYEELVSSYGFSGIYSNIYHTYAPTKIAKIGTPEAYTWEADPDPAQKLRQTHLKTSTLKSTGTDFLEARTYLLANADCALGLFISETPTMPYCYKNGEADEVLFIHEGSGVLHSQFGAVAYRPGDYLVIPRTTIYRLNFDAGVPHRILIIESKDPVETVSRYRNNLGQLLEHSPYCERDIRPPVWQEPDLAKAEHLIKIKKQGYLHNYFYDFSPFNAVGWDGFLYPYAFSIHDFEPITGRIHQPPPVHQTFQAKGFVICSFVPRLFDYHPLAIPAPYNHSNIDSDEVLYYVEGNFMSRKGIDRGSFTLHPGGLPHGPHPGTVEASIGAKETIELAVMIDTFRPLQLTKQGRAFLDEQYPMSWSQ